MRGLVSRRLQDYLRYWIDEYKRQQLHNHLDDAAISEIDLVKVRRDPYYDAVTVRVYASGLDYTLDDAGKVVGGSKTTARTYSEYWTFLRASARRGPIVTTPACPNCGAPLDVIADSGACAHCSAVIDNGQLRLRAVEDRAGRGLRGLAMTSNANVKVGIIMGSHSDWATMKHAADVLDELGVAYEKRIVSAHRTPDLLFEYAETAAERGLQRDHRRRRRRGAPARA